MKILHWLRGSVVLRDHFTWSSGRCCSHAAVFSSNTVRTQDLEDTENLTKYPVLPGNHLRRLPLTADEFRKRKALIPVQPENPHLLKVALVGEPNVGKSSLINSLVKCKVFPVSKKVHTTRRRGYAVIVEGNKQVVFLDTPGFVTPEHSKRHKLEVSLVVDPKNSAAAADLIGVVVDASNQWANKAISPGILQLLDNLRDKPSILILNKVDALKSKSALLQICKVLTEQKTWKEQKDLHGEGKDLDNDDLILGREPPKIEPSSIPKFFPDSEMMKKRGWPYFSQVFMISALLNDGVDHLREFMFSMAKPAPWMYHSSSITDQHPHQLVKQIIKEKLLDALPKEIPYGLSVYITSWVLDTCGTLRITASISCPNSRHRSFVIGRSGSLISKLVENARQDIVDAFKCETLLKIAVK